MSAKSVKILWPGPTLELVWRVHRVVAKGEERKIGHTISNPLQHL